MSEETYLFVDEEGIEHNFEIVDIFEYESSKYAIVVEDDNEEAMLLRVNELGGNMQFEMIDDDEEFEEVREAYLNEDVVSN